MRQGFWIVLLLLLGGCGQPPTPVALPSTPFATVPSPTRAAMATATLVPSATRRSAATITPRPTRPTSTADVAATESSVLAMVPPTEDPLAATATLPPPTATFPAPTMTALPPTTTAPTVTAPRAQGVACARPPEDYRRIMLGRHSVSMRTLAMLDNAQALYGGQGSMRLLIQGSYAPGLDASFGTHDGGGAVDIWAVDPRNTRELLADIPQMVMALRQAGFAAWYRPADMLYQGMYPHIHAIALGDADLSEGARAQIEGPDGYLAGRNGLPQAEFAGPDPHGGPVLCAWFSELGYGTPGAESQPSSTPEVPPSPAPEPTSSTALACTAPIDDYTRITVDGHTVTQRTYSMLQTAQAIYGGPGNLLWVTQGSYTPSEPGSFGTHDGGGAVDISIRHPGSWEFLYNETERMVAALRLAGFAAWYRAPGDLGPGSVPHLHAIAIGDAELSEAATAQLTGEQGYFRGRNGLPQPEYAREDRHGGPVLCPWMEELGYQDLRN